MMTARNKRTNGSGNAVFDIYGQNNDALASVEVNSKAPGNLRVLIGALTPTGKEHAWDAIRRYELPR